MTLLAILALAGCDRQRAQVSATSATVALIDGAQSPALTTGNPFAGQPAAVEEGKRLFTQMNCAGCHGYDLKGGTMAPNLTDRYWRYGGTPAQIYSSIANGRPKGMPTWRNALPAEEIWKLVSYIQSQGGATPAADYQAGEQGDLAAQPVRPPAGSGSGANPAAARSAIP
jgi:cytochrome c oxidase cbb3-type subunit 3